MYEVSVHIVNFWGLGSCFPVWEGFFPRHLVYDSCDSRGDKPKVSMIVKDGPSE